MAKRGLYSNIHAKRKRIAAGSGEKCVKQDKKVDQLLNNLRELLKLLRNSFF